MLGDALCTAFCGVKKIARGSILEVALSAKKFLSEDPQAQILVFDDESKIVELDLRGSLADVKERMALASTSRVEEFVEEVSSRGRGRPKLGVVSREVTLLPRHWDWLNEQPGGASVVLRKLVEKARLSDQSSPRHAREICYKFMSAMGGNLPAFEEASRALFAGNKEKFFLCVGEWPHDLVQHLTMISSDAF